jgi:hypothetical protein
MTGAVIKEARRRGKVRAYVDAADLAARFQREMTFWSDKGIDINTGERLFTEATTQVVERVLGWINAGEVAVGPDTYCSPRHLSHVSPPSIDELNGIPMTWRALFYLTLGGGPAGPIDVHEGPGAGEATKVGVTARHLQGRGL